MLCDAINWIVPLEFSSEVCSGGKLILTCSTNGSLLLWNISIPDSGSPSQFASGRQVVDAGTSLDGGIINVPIRSLNITQFANVMGHFTNFGTLTSTLSITNVMNFLNGTIINCIEPKGTESKLLVLTNINVIHSAADLCKC